MGLPYERDLKVLARSLRNSMTDAERKLWAAIRRKQVQGMLFTRQRPVGEYIVDFLCSSASLVVEVDGGQHFTAEGRRNDRRRDSALEELGLRVLRFSDRDVLTNLKGVLRVIWEACGEAQNPLAPPLPKGEEVPVASGSPKGKEIPVAFGSPKGEEVPVASGSPEGAASLFPPSPKGGRGV